MRHRIAAIGFYAVGLLCSGLAIVAAQGGLWWPAAVLVLAASVLYGLGEYHREALRAAVEARRARERARRAVILAGPSVAAGMAAMGEAARTAGTGLARLADALDGAEPPTRCQECGATSQCPLHTKEPSP